MKGRVFFCWLLLSVSLKFELLAFSDSGNDVFVLENHILLINTLPKSGSVFLIDGFKKNLDQIGYLFVRISENRFHDDYVDEGTLQRMSNSFVYTQEHIDASSKNIEIIKKYIPKMVLHLRDPRQAFLSWVYHVEENDHRFLWSSDICPPPDYFDWTIEQKIDWQIEHYLPACIDWINGWCRILDLGEIDILVTRYEDMIEDYSKFFGKIFDFYDIKIPGEIEFAPFMKGSLHQRKGSVNEWESVLTDRQKKRVHEIVPEELLKRFGWDVEGEK